ncbi:MAG: beta-galactosidase, partial [Planctomycetota bacterium]
MSDDLSDITLTPDLSGPPLGRADVSHTRPTNLDRMWLGCCYYPEHWDAAMVERDAQRMKDAGVNTVRMAEFAWTLMEPRPGEFDFSLFDRAIDLLAAQGIDTLLCTPTATPPRWMTQMHPDMLRVDAAGRVMVHGSRQHCSHMSETLRRYSKRITRAMAEHWKGHDAVVGWQTDNEFHCHFSEDHSDAAQLAFQRWCAHKYESNIAALNDAWGTSFWSQQYDDFTQIVTPRTHAPTFPSPGHALDYFRFLSDAVALFQRDQVEVLRDVKPDWRIFHNGVFPHIDYRGPFGQDLDFFGVDVYPLFVEPQDRVAWQSFMLDRTRGYCGNFVVPEQQSGPGGQGDYFLEPTLPGELRQFAFRSVARGADGLLFFRWRTARFGAEQYWCGMLDHDDKPGRRFLECKQTLGDLAKVGQAALGSRVVVDVAVAAADETVNDAHAPLTLGLPKPDKIAEQVHRAFAGMNLGVGTVHPADVLDDLRLYVIPHWSYFDPKWADHLRQWVEAGGTLVVGARTATRDVRNQIVADTPPGVFAEMAGVTVAEFGTIRHEDTRPLSMQMNASFLYPPTAPRAVKHW